MNWSSGNASSFEQPPLGPHFARCIKIIDIGTQTGEYQGKKTVRRQNILTWELPNALMESGKPFTVSKFYTANIANEKANLRKDVVAWRGGKDLSPEEIDNFDPKSLLGQPCQVSITKKDGSDKHQVSSVLGIPAGMDVPEPTNEFVFFDLENFDQATFDSLTDGLKRLIMLSPEYASIVGGEDDVNQDVTNQDIPF